MITSGDRYYASKNHREVFIGEGTYGCVLLFPTQNIICKRSKHGVQRDFIREVVHLTAMRESPYVIKILGFDIRRGEIYLEKATGSLSMSISSRVDVDHVIACILRGLLALHKEGIWHNDIKPDNILLKPDNTVCVADLGLSCTGSRDWSGERGGVYTLWYCPPEILPHYYDHMISYDGVSADLYAVGMVLWDLLTSDNYHLHSLFHGTDHWDQKQRIDSILGVYPIQTPITCQCPTTEMTDESLQARIQSLFDHQNQPVSSTHIKILSGLLHPNPCQRWGYKELKSYYFLGTLTMFTVEKSQWTRLKLSAPHEIFNVVWDKFNTIIGRSKSPLDFWHFTHTSSPLSFKQQPWTDVTISMYFLLVDWLQLVFGPIVSQECLFLALVIIRRRMTLEIDMKRNRLQLIGMVAISVANEYISKTGTRVYAAQLNNYCCNAYSVQEIQNEMHVLFSQTYQDLYRPTAYTSLVARTYHDHDKSTFEKPVTTLLLLELLGCGWTLEPSELIELVIKLEDNPTKNQSNLVKQAVSPSICRTFSKLSMYTKWIESNRFVPNDSILTFLETIK